MTRIGPEALIRIDLAYAERRLEDVGKRLFSLRAKIHTPHELVAKYMAAKGYSAAEIERLVGIPRPKIFVYAKRLGFTLTSGKGMTCCSTCDRTYSALYNFCPLCGRSIVPKTRRPKFTAKGEPL